MVLSILFPGEFFNLNLRSIRPQPPPGATARFPSRIGASFTNAFKAFNSSPPAGSHRRLHFITIAPALSYNNLVMAQLYCCTDPVELLLFIRRLHLPSSLTGVTETFTIVLIFFSAIHRTIHKLFIVSLTLDMEPVVSNSSDIGPPVEHLFCSGFWPEAISFHTHHLMTATTIESHALNVLSQAAQDLNPFQATMQTGGVSPRQLLGHQGYVLMGLMGSVLCFGSELIMGILLGLGINLNSPIRPIWLGILREVLGFLSSPIRPIVILVDTLYSPYFSSAGWVSKFKLSIGGLDCDVILLALGYLFPPPQSFGVFDLVTHISTSLSDGFSRLRESLVDVMPLSWRVVNPGRFQIVRRYISLSESQRVNSLLEKFYTAITRALNGFFRAALHWSYFGKCEIYVIKHLDPIEGFCILGDYHRVSMSPEDLSLYLSYVIVSRLVFYFSVSWFEDAIKMDVEKM